MLLRRSLNVKDSGKSNERERGNQDLHTRAQTDKEVQSLSKWSMMMSQSSGGSFDDENGVL